MDEKDKGGEPITFSIKFCTYNRSKKKGGQIIHLTKAVKCGLSHDMNENNTIGVKQLDSANHPYPVQIRLITEFNDQKVFF